MRLRSDDRYVSGVVALVATMCMAIGAGPAAGQANRNQRVPVRLASDTNRNGDTVTLPTPPRELKQALARARECIEDDRYSDAVEAIGQILDAPGAEDYFLLEGEEGAQASLKREALRLLGTLPEAGREFYELQVGSTAQRALDEAIDRRSFHDLQEVSRRYFHTPAGYQATLLLARWDMDQNRPLAAALNLQRLRETAAAAALYEPELSLLLTICFRQSGESRRAEELLAELQETHPGARFATARGELTLAGASSDLLAWLDELIGQPTARKAEYPAQWNMFRGAPNRNATCAGGMPLPKLEWSVDSTVYTSDGQFIEQLQSLYQQQGLTALPVLQPLAIGDFLLMRTPRLLFGVDLESGRRIWPYPWDGSEELEFPEGRETGQEDGQVQRQALLRQRMWDDAPYGQMSSDGRRLFILRDLDQTEVFGSAELMWRRDFSQPSLVGQQFNRLVALELVSEGKTLWTVGGADGDEPQLQDAFFLGPPLPIGDRLYLVVEIKDEIKLVVLKAATGQLEWSQQLALVEPPFSLRLDHPRRLGGATPSYADGVLVCPTSSGAVVAVDLITRSLLWGYCYERAHPSDATPARVLGSSFVASLLPPPGKRWADSLPILAEKSVLLTPIESSQLHCLDLVTGKPKWDPIPRGDALYVAGVYNGLIVLVGNQKVQGIKLADGEPAWPPLPLPEGARPSGRGFITEGALYVPTTASQVVKIAIDTGQVVEVVETDFVLGNLVCHGDYVISQGTDAVRAFLQRDRMRAVVTRRLAEQPNDPVALEDYATVLASDGQLDEAVSALQRAIELYSNEESRRGARTMLVRILLNSLERDFASRATFVDKVTPLLETRADQHQFHRIMAEGLQRENDLPAALDHYLSLLDLIGGADAGQWESGWIDEAEPGLRIREDLWIGRQIRRIVESLPAEQMNRALEEVSRRLEEALSARSPDRVQAWLRCFPEDAQAAQARMHLARDAVAGGQLLEADTLLASLEESPSRAVAGEALARRASLLSAAGFTANAMRLCRRLREDWGRTPVLEGKTGRELYRTYAAQWPGLEAGIDYPAWPQGEVESSSYSSTPYRGVYPIVSIPILERSGGWPEGYRLFLDRQNRFILVEDEYGVPLARVPIPADEQRHQILQAQPGMMYAKAFGHLLVVVLGTDLVAIDVLGAVDQSGDRILWSSFGQHPLAESTLQLLAPHGINRQLQNIPLAEPIIVKLTINGEPVLELASVARQGVCYLRRGNLVCVSPLSGEVRWERKQLGTDCVAFGDASRVFVQARGKGTARVFAVVDGSELESVRVPKVERQWRRLGGRILTWDGNSLLRQPLKLHLYDALSESDVWHREVAYGSRACFVDDDELAVIQPNGKLEILALRDGATRVAHELPGDESLESLHVIRSAREYVVIVGRKDAAQANRIRQGIYPSGPFSTGGKSPQIVGEVLAFDRASGHPAWKQPIPVTDYFLPLDQPVELPLLVFARNVAYRDQISRSRATPPSEAVGSLVCLDRRDGSLLFRRDNLAAFSAPLALQGNVRKYTVSIQLGYDSGIQLAFTDKPRSTSDLDPATILPAPTRDRAPAENHEEPNDG
jgi:outer membrane protein assembly factor BamB/thioredoxin-like negative regulator of GroEL